MVETAQNVLEFIKNGTFKKDLKDVKLLEKEGILYTREGNAGFLGQLIKVSHKAEYGSASGVIGLEKLTIDRDGILHGTLDGGMHFHIRLLKTETKLNIGTGYLGMLASLNTTFLDIGLDAALKAGDLKEGEYGLKTKAEVQALVAKLEGDLKFSFFGLKFKLKGAVSLGAGASGELKVTNKQTKLKVGAHFGLGAEGEIDVKYDAEEFGPERYLQYLNEKRHELREAEEKYKQAYAKHEEERKNMVDSGSKEDREWWQIGDFLDVQSQWFLGMVRDDLREGKDADTSLELLRARLNQRYQKFQERYNEENKKEHKDRYALSYLREQKRIIRQQYKLFSSKDILEKLQDGRALQEFKEIPGSGYCPQDLQIDMMKTMQLIGESLKDVDKISTSSEASLAWYAGGKELMSDKDVQNVRKGLDENLKKRKGFKGEDMDQNLLDSILPALTESEVTVDYLVNLWGRERPEDLETYINTTVEEMTKYMKMDVYKDMILRPYPMQLFVQLDSLISRYRHAEDENEEKAIKGDIMARKDLADQILFACGKLGYYMSNIDRIGKAIKTHREK